MTVIRSNSISGINSITAQSASLNFYDTSGNTLSIGASVTGDITGNVTGNVTGDVTGDVNAGVVTATSSIVVGDSFVKATSIGIGTTTTAGRNAGVGTAVGTLIYNSTKDMVEVYTPTGWDVVGNRTDILSATGGTEDTSSRPGWKVHIFNDPGTFTVTAGTNDVEYLVVAGGGGGHGTLSGGGGGGYRTGTLSISPGTYPVIRGGGGTGGVWSPSTPATNGVDSVFGPITSDGGGAGGDGNPGPGFSGGSGGGGRFAGTGGAATGYPGPDQQGYPGGQGGHPTNLGPGPNGVLQGGGGGGAGAAGGDATWPWGSPVSCFGGDGLSSSITGSPVTRAGGGGGGAYDPSGAVHGVGGSGGGGDGKRGSSNGDAGSPNTGGGGGGGGSTPTVGYAGGAGGSGIVIIAYQTS